MELQKILELYTDQVDADDISALSSVCGSKTYSKGEHIIAQGDTDNCLYLIKSGIFRVYCLIDGVEDTVCFGHTGDAFMSFHSFFRGEPSPFSCIAMSSVEVFRITSENLKSLFSQRPHLLEWYNRMLVEELYLLERKYVYFGNKDAYSRFAHLWLPAPTSCAPFLQNISPSISRFVRKHFIAFAHVTSETMNRPNSETLLKNTSSGFDRSSLNVLVLASDSVILRLP